MVIDRPGVFLLLLMALWPLNAFAIINVEEAQIGAPAEGVSGRLNLDVQGLSGNTNKINAGAGGLLQWHGDRLTDFILLHYAFGKSNGRTDTNKAFGHLRHRFEVDKLWAVEGFAQVSRDEFARLSFRGLLGGGIRLTLREEESSRAAYLGLGGFYEREILHLAPNTTDPRRTTTWRGNVYLLLKYRLNEHIRFANTLYYQPAFSRPSDFRLLEEAGLYVPLHGNLDLKLTLEVAHDSRPPQTVKKTDVIYSTGLELNF